jgi:hypothetical protein
MSVETWLPIDGYPDYEISDHGRVRRTTSRTCAKAGTILRTPLRTGYPCVDLCRDGKKKTHHVHRLVAAVFIGPAQGGHSQEVNHINGIKTDNCALNLEYVTRSGNQLHAYRLGLQDASGEKNGKAKLTEAQVSAIRRLASQAQRPSYSVIGAQFGVSEATARLVAQGKIWNQANKNISVPSWHVLKFTSGNAVLQDARFVSRFWARVLHQDAGCWIWTGGRYHPDDYGVVVWMIEGKRYTTGAHRVAYALAHSCDLPEALVLHRCDVRGCCRPDHLFLGTYQDNTQDFLQKAKDRKATL